MAAAHHLYLVPGFFGFANLGQIAYFGHVRRFLEARLPGFGIAPRIHVVRLSPTASLARRAACLAETISSTVQRGGAPVHLIGHSSGGLDVRLLLTPAASLPTAVDTERVAERVRSAVSVVTPHHGTPLASFFATLRGQRLLQLLSVGTIHLLHLGRLPLSALLPIGAALARLGDLASSNEVVDELFGSLLEDFSVGRRRAVRNLLRQVAYDQALLPQLTPEAMEVFNVAVHDRPGVRYASVIAQAAVPSLRTTLRTGLDPTAQVMHGVYRALHRLAAATPARRAPSLAPPHARALRRAFGAVPTPAANDGIVPTRSQPWGQILHAVVGDHLDVLGHFRSAGQTPPHVDWLSTGSGFGAADFERLWTRVARFVARDAA